MDLEVAVDKLNHLSRVEILQAAEEVAWKYGVRFTPKVAEDCPIAVLLAEWVGEPIRVVGVWETGGCLAQLFDPIDADDVDPDSGVQEAAHLKEHVRHIACDVDEGRMNSWLAGLP